MPDMTPVATQIQPPNTLNAFANVVNIKKGMAEANQAQQQNQELTALHQFTSQAMKDPSYHNEDGSLNVQKFQTDAMKVAPVYGQQYIGQATSNANEGLANRKALLDLTADQRKVAGGYFASVAANPKATKSDFLDAVEEAREASKDPAYQRSIDSLLLHAPQTHDMNPEQSAQAYRQYARGVALAVSAPGTDQSSPAISLMQGPRGQQAIQTNPQSPMGVGPTGDPMQQGISPQVVTQPGTGAPAVVGPGGQATPITGAPGTAQANWWQPQPGQLAMLQGNVQGVVQRTQAAAAAANTSPQAIDALDRAGAIIDQGVFTGTAFSGFKDLKNLAASLGIDTKNAADSSELAKNIARYEAARAQAVGDTDASRALFAAASPDTKYDAKAVKAVIQQSLANERIIQSYAQLMQSAPDPQTAMQRESVFRSIPHLLQTFELGQMKSKEEVDAFLKRYDISGAELAKSRAMLQQLGIQ